MPYVKKRKDPPLTELRNLPKLRTRSRHEILRKYYLSLAVFVGLTAVVSLVTYVVMSKPSF